MGGTDEKENLIELTVEEHAEAHKKLWEEYGFHQDYLAWQGLAGLMTKQEIVKIQLSEAGKLGALHNYKRKGMKYKSNPNTIHKPHKGTTGLKWYHNPENVLEKCCLRDDQEIPKGWVRGQGKKAINPGLNFHVKRLKSL